MRFSICVALALSTSCLFSIACSDGATDDPDDQGAPDGRSTEPPVTPGADATADVSRGDDASTPGTGRDASEGDARSDAGNTFDATTTADAPSPDVDARDPNRDVVADNAIDNAVRDANADVRNGDGSASDSGTGDTLNDAKSADAATRPDVASDAAMPPITIWIAGDSTVQTYPAGNTSGVGGRELEGWGQELAPFFNDKVTISNQAIGGRSVAFFMWSVARDSAGTYLCVDADGTPQFELDAQGNRIDTAQWARIKNGIKPGDYLLAQFGTNDRARACPKYVNLTDFETYFGMMADAIRAKGATPIFVTPMGQRSFTGTTANNSLLPYANAMKHEAMSKSVSIADLNLRSVEYYTLVGNDYLAANIFDTGSTHFVKAGAIKMASLVAGEIRAGGSGLAAYLK